MNLFDLSLGNTNSKSDPTLPPHAKPDHIAFPQITPQNYQSVSDPTAQKPVDPQRGSGKPKSKFDELYQKAIEDTEGALQKSLTEENIRKAEANGLFTQGTAGSGIPLAHAQQQRNYNSDLGGDLGNRSDHSRASSKSHKSATDAKGPMSIMDLRDMDDLPTTTKVTTRCPVQATWAMPWKTRCPSRRVRPMAASTWIRRCPRRRRRIRCDRKWFRTRIAMMVMRPRCNI